MNGTDDPGIYDGAHVGLQLVGRRLQEEKVLALTEYVAGLLPKATEPASELRERL